MEWTQSSLLYWLQFSSSAGNASFTGKINPWSKWVISGLTSDQNKGVIRRRDLGLKFPLKDRIKPATPEFKSSALKHTLHSLPK